MAMRVDARCQQIELILSDVDGVFTDGRVIFDNQGIETKQFNIRDGLGIKLWHRAGYQFGIITARTSHIVRVRAAELDIDILRQGCNEKLLAAREIMEQLRLSPDNLCYIGDDLPDLSLIKTAGLGVAVADSASDVLSAADHVTQLAGGRGAVREVIEMILKAKDRWSDLVRKFE